MIRKIFLWLLDWLRLKLDPEAKAHAEGYAKAVDATGQLEKEEQQKRDELHAEQQQIDGKIQSVNSQIEAEKPVVARINEQIKEVEADEKQKRGSIRHASDDDALPFDLKLCA